MFHKYLLGMIRKRELKLSVTQKLGNRVLSISGQTTHKGSLLKMCALFLRPGQKLMPGSLLREGSGGCDFAG